MKEYTRRIMHRSVNPLTFIATGLIIAALPFLGFPAAWETFFQVSTGIILAFLCAAEWWKHREKHTSADTFVESRTLESDTVQHHAPVPAVEHQSKPIKAPEMPRKDDSIRTTKAVHTAPSSRSSGVVSPYVAAPDSGISHVTMPQGTNPPKTQKVRERRSNVKTVATSLPQAPSPVITPAKPRSPKRRSVSGKSIPPIGSLDRP